MQCTPTICSSVCTSVSVNCLRISVGIWQVVTSDQRLCMKVFLSFSLLCSLFIGVFSLRVRLYSLECLFVCFGVSVFLCVFYVCTFVCAYVCAYVCTCVCTCVCAYVCALFIKYHYMFNVQVRRQRKPVRKQR